MKLIGLIGRARVGKDTVAEYLIQHYQYQQYAFADPMKDMLETVFGGLFRTGDREQVIPWLGKSPRQLMQTLGTEWGRNTVHPDLWTLLGKQQILHSQTQNQSLVISDVRFHNEADMILEQGGELWHVQRETTEQVNSHTSEQYEWADYPTKLISNNGSLNELYYQIESKISGATFDDFLARVRNFSEEDEPKLCRCDHKLQGTGAIFFQSVKLLRCANCYGWQHIRKPIK